MQHIPLGTNFSTRQAQRTGVSRSRLRRHDLQAPHHGVRATAAAEDIVQRCRAFAPAMTDRMLFSHETAAQLHGLPLPRRRGENGVLHVSAQLPTRAPRHRGVHGHQTRLVDEDVVRVQGMRVASPVETWCQLAVSLGERDLVVMGDALVRRALPPARMEDLERAVESGYHRPGIRRLRTALGKVRARTDSPMETILRLALIRGGLPEPMVNYGIADADGRVVAHADLAYPWARVAVEYDGEHHRTDDRQYHIDVDRLWEIQALGWTVVRLNRSHLGNGAAIAVARVRQAVSFD